MGNPTTHRARRLMLLVLLVSALVLAGAGTALAKAHAIPGGPKPTEDPPVAGIMTYPELVNALYQIEHTSKGALEVYTLAQFLSDYDVKTTSELGQELYLAKIGHGPTRVWVSAGIHGPEQLTSEALLSVLKKLAGGGSPEIQKLLDTLTIYAMPCLSPDDRDAFNYMHTVYDDVTGNPLPYPLNLNRDWYQGPAQRPPYLVGPRADETKAWYACFCKIQPHYLLDLHHMGVGLVSGTNEMCSLELGISLSPDRYTIPDVPEPLYDDRTFRDMVRQLQCYIYDNLSGYGYSNIQRYWAFFVNETEVAELNFKGGMSSAVMLGKHWMNYMGWNDADWKCPAIFLETKGNTSDLGQKANGYLTKQNEQGIMAFLTGIATGKAWEVDPLHWYDIPAFPCWGYYCDDGNWPKGDSHLDPPLPY